VTTDRGPDRGQAVLRATLVRLGPDRVAHYVGQGNVVRILATRFALSAEFGVLCRHLGTRPGGEWFLPRAPRSRDGFQI